MIINRTTEYMNYREAHPATVERGPRYIRKRSGSEHGADIIEISDAGRRLHREKQASPLVKAALLVSGDIGALVLAAEQEMDLRRSQAVGTLRDSIGSGDYDFDRTDRVIAAAEKILAR